MSLFSFLQKIQKKLFILTFILYRYFEAERRNKIMERISMELIRKGISQKIIVFGMEDDQLVAHIGDYWFFITDEPGKDESCFSEDELIEMVYSAVNDEPINDDIDEYAIECLYYKTVLEENIKEE